MCIMLSYAMLCYDELRGVMLCYAVLRSVTVCYVMLCDEEKQNMFNHTLG